MIPIISIIIPVYNLGNYLEKCVESIICQSFQSWEVIIVNDGSTDNSLSVCNSLLSRDSRIRVINQENKGVSYARNTGIKAAQGQWILFIDGDDTLCPDALLSMLRVAENNEVDVVITSFVRNGQIQRYEKEGVYTYKEYELATLRLMLQMSTQNRLYKRSLFQDVGYCIDRKISNNEDFLQNIVLLPCVNKVAVYNIPTYNVFERPGSASRREFPLDYWMMFFNYSEMLFSENGISDEIYGRMFLNRVYYLLRRYPNYKFKFNKALVQKVIKGLKHSELDWRERLMLLAIRMPRQIGFKIIQCRLNPKSLKK